LRVLAGAVATEIRLSVWLLGFSLFVFLSLAFLKRASELRSLQAETGGEHFRRGYRSPDYQLVQTMGVASAFTASLVLALYLNSEAARAFYAAPAWLWLVVPLQPFPPCRLCPSSSRGTPTPHA